jgi:hypothetical protein
MSSVDDGDESQEPAGRVIIDEPAIRVPTESPREFLTPLVLLVIGLIALLGSALAIHGGAGVLAAWVLFALVCLVQVPITIAGMYLLTAVLGISYGLLRSALLKLAAITTFVLGFTLLGDAFGYPILTQFLLLPVSWYLFGALFDLDVWETVVSLLGFFLMGITFFELIGRVVPGTARWFG